MISKFFIVIQKSFRNAADLHTTIINSIAMNDFSRVADDWIQGVP
jgi:hypothetical protein|tara:strand:+ start:50 stop:184 length:135 start_codon:yes stop_codon:yes gene_type:complete